MLKYKNILFDLDGTISDSSEGIFKALEYTFNKYGKPLPDIETLKTFIGPPLEVSFVKFFDEDVWDVVNTFREYYLPIGLFENKLYDGFKDMLIELKNRGYKIYVATSKGEGSAKKVLGYLEILELFDGVIGASVEKMIRSKEDVLNRLFSVFSLNKNESILIGDTKYDCMGAQTIGIDCGAVLYGFGKEKDFLPFKLKFMANSVNDILEFF